MAKSTIKKEGDLEILENPDVLAERLTHGSEDFVKKNRNVLLGLFVVIAAAIVGGFLYYNYRSTQNEEAQAAMFQAVFYFEADSLGKALNGDGQHQGLLSVADEYGSTKAGNLARFYAGTALLKQGKYQQALDYLEDYKSDDLILQGRAYALQGDANLELGKPQEAADVTRPRDAVATVGQFDRWFRQQFVIGVTKENATVLCGHKDGDSIRHTSIL